MATLNEGFTLCGLVQTPSASDSAIQGIELDGDSDHAVVTDSTRSVTLYKVSDQKPLGSWTVKQGQLLTCPAVCNFQTKEYVVVSDNKVIRVWKDEDLNLDKVFKATVSADVWRVHSAPGGEPVVLFQRGAVRLLDSLLSAPQQPIEDILSEEEVIRWSTNMVAEKQHFVLFTTEQKGEHFLYVQRLNPNTLQKYRLEREDSGAPPLSFSASLWDKHINLLYLYRNGCVYQSVVAVRGPVGLEGVQALPRSLRLRLPVGELGAASAVALDEAHVAVVGMPHPSARTGKDFLCIWNTNFQTLQAGKEMVGRIHGQVWCYLGKLFVPHGKALSVIPYECQKSSLASALGKLQHAGIAVSRSSVAVPSWNTLLHGDQPQGPTKIVDTRRSKLRRKSQSAPALTVDEVVELIKTGPVEEVQREVEALVSRGEAQDLQLSVGWLARHLVARSQAETAFYTPGSLAQLVQTQCLCHSVCPDLLLLALEHKDYFLCQLCLQLFPDIPEVVTCACLKTFISVPDGDVEMVSLEPDSVSLMEGLVAAGARGGQQNGFSPPLFEEDSCDAHHQPKPPQHQDKKNPTLQLEVCPVGLHKAVLLNEVLQTPYSDNLLLPHLKDLNAQQVILFLQYLHFVYLKYSQDVYTQTPGLRSPTVTQIIDWVCLLLDAHFTVLVMAPDAKGLLSNLQSFVKSQVKLFSELGKIEGSLQELHKMKPSKDISQYSIEVIELF
ncbi:nucleolar protein 11-like [Salmo salar]|uniref:Nucleolar protein 11-like n=1 Tax=Salmo salar TaxID=8030 RepID=B5X4C9_SALSA|nr:nucleolar protein 11-like [Salmo salar]ACI34160.1 Nucleolar protein 11-like [Salmo salar]|eukprot:NP_001133931.1 nucleolar protein 11-like [Salmo salar]